MAPVALQEPLNGCVSGRGAAPTPELSFSVRSRDALLRSGQREFEPAFKASGLPIEQRSTNKLSLDGGTD
jgi:hypothetical protein